MHFRTSTISAFGLFILSTLAHKSHCPPKPAGHDEQHAAWNDYIHEFYYEKNQSKAIDRFYADDFIQHNPFILSGKNNSLTAIPFFLAGFNFTIMNMGFDNNKGWVHTKVDRPGQASLASVDIMLLSGTCMVEHWDVQEAIPAGADNPIALFGNLA